MPRKQPGSRSGGSFGRGKKPGPRGERSGARGDKSSFSKKKMFGGLRKTTGGRGGKAPSKAPRKAPPVKVSVDSMVDEDQLNDGKIRLQKYLASAGLGSRRKCEELIQSGRISIDGEPVTEMGVKVDPATQSIEFDGGRLKRQTLTYYIFNKPKGVLCTNIDPDGRQRVIDFFPPNGPRVFPVGRLDEDSEGLLLVTNDGNWGNKLAHPRYRIYRTYLVQVAGHPDDETLKQLIKGMFFTEGKFRFHLVERKKKQGRSSFLEVTLAEGKNREVRRLFARVGHKVMKLLRVGFGPLKLGRLKTGEHRTLTPIEMQMVADIWSKAKSQPTREETKPTEFKTITLFDKQDEQAPAPKTKKQDQAKFAKIKGKIMEADYDDEEELVFQQFLDTAEEPTDEDLAYRDETDISVPAMSEDVEEVYTEEIDDELDDELDMDDEMDSAEMEDEEFSEEDFSEEDFTEAYSEEDYFEDNEKPEVEPPKPVVAPKSQPAPEIKPLLKGKAKSVTKSEPPIEPEKPKAVAKKFDTPAPKHEVKSAASGRGSLFKKKKNVQAEQPVEEVEEDLENEVPLVAKKYDDTSEPEIINTAPGITEEEAPELDEMYQDEMFYFADEAADGDETGDDEEDVDYEEYMVETDEDFEEKPQRGRRGTNDRGPANRGPGNRPPAGRDAGGRRAGPRSSGDRGGSRGAGRPTGAGGGARDGFRSGNRGGFGGGRPAGGGRSSESGSGERRGGARTGGRSFQRDDRAGGNYRGRDDRGPAGGERRRSFGDRDQSSQDRPTGGRGGFRDRQDAGPQGGPPRRGQGARTGGGRPMNTSDRPARDDGGRAESGERRPSLGRGRFNRDGAQPGAQRSGYGRRDDQGGGEQRGGERRGRYEDRGDQPRAPRSRSSFGDDRGPRTGGPRTARSSDRAPRAGGRDFGGRDAGSRGPRGGSRDAGARPGFRDRNQGDDAARGPRSRGDQGSDPHFFGERKDMPKFKRKPNMRRNKKKKDE